MKIKSFVYAVPLIAAGLLTSCKGGDPTVEAKFDGSWICTHTETEYEDGVEITTTGTETITFDAQTHKLVTSVEITITQPVHVWVCTITTTGTWSADANHIYQHINLNDNDFFFNHQYLDSDEQNEFKINFIKEFEANSMDEIIKINKDKFVIFDGEDNMNYYRVIEDDYYLTNDAEVPETAEVITPNADPVKLHLTASDGINGHLQSQGNNTYVADNLVDSDPKTAWVVKLSETDYDTGDYLYGPNLKLNANRIDFIKIRNGYCKSMDSYTNNTRAAWIMIYRPDFPDTGNPEPYNIIYEGPLSDTMDWQTLNVDPRFDNSIKTEDICISFSNKSNNRFYHGNKWDDLSVSEIEVYGVS